MLVPAMQATGTRSSSSTSRTPRWAPPRAPPPPSTRPMRGLAPVCASAEPRMPRPSAAARAPARRARWIVVMVCLRTIGTPTCSARATLDLEAERGEAGVAVVVVLLLGALEPADHRVGDRREGDLDRDLGHELREHHRRELVVGDDARAVEDERVEDRRIDPLAEDRRSDGARP